MGSGVEMGAVVAVGTAVGWTVGTVVGVAAAAGWTEGTAVGVGVSDEHAISASESKAISGTIRVLKWRTDIEAPFSSSVLQ